MKYLFLSLATAVLSPLPVALAQSPADILQHYAEAAKGHHATKTKAILIHQWLAHTTEAHSHRLRGATDNQTYLHKDGHKEAVFDAKGNLVKDGINDASYNYAHPIKDPLNHFALDTLPWLVWGNTQTDPTSIEERVEGYVLDLIDGMLSARESKRTTAQTDLDEVEAQVAAFFSEVLATDENTIVWEILKGTEPTTTTKLKVSLRRSLLKALALQTKPSDTASNNDTRKSRAERAQRPRRTGGHRDVPVHLIKSRTQAMGCWGGTGSVRSALL